jgi:hypothetical protein
VGQEEEREREEAEAVTPGKQRLEEARRRVSKLLTVGDVLGHVDPAAVRAAALGPLTPPQSASQSCSRT